ncbi:MULTISPECIES: thioesterase family protein [unclassified Pseudofrankia]|uniref:acyl-CoA thioesterase n=1 Tax=unclassified Pseudofrankia TaxID=2994372 RepID=UPI0008DAA892|nr:MULTISPECIES: thioesterase family protein [unclassified Pseudofrankia]MDT3444667.1 thioesterase family protein [Pseudofrankia sp. BMG5.37]OHV66590.1 hypothetical protein BCD48_35920 [Pseudofrankia sp. BMG5.36]
MPAVVNVPIETHYHHFDQQGVAFNMWYLAFLEQARNGYLAAQGYSLKDLLVSGHDIQVVHVEIDWTAAVRYGDEVDIGVTAQRVGTTSFALGFSVNVQGRTRATASITYVIVDAAVKGKAPIPDGLRSVLGR